MKILHKTKMILAFISIVMLLALTNQFCICDYIRSEELVLSDNVDAGSEVINLSKLMFVEKKHEFDNKKKYLFKLVNDSPLCNFLEIKYLSIESVMIVKKKLDYDLICSKTSDEKCVQSIKIIAINENDFIEIPIEVHKSKKEGKTVSTHFESASIRLNATSIQNQFKIESAKISLKEESSSNVEYKIVDEASFINRDYFDAYLTKNDQRVLLLNIKFKSRDLLEKAFILNKQFNFKIVSYLNTTNAKNVKNGTLNIALSVGFLDEVTLKPLDFERSIYTLVIENEDELKLNDVIIRPKLKNIQSNRGIVYSLLLEDQVSDKDFPFQINETNGSIYLKNLLRNDNDQAFTEKLYSFGIKAVYNKTSASSDYLDYLMLPAFAKVQLNFRRSYKMTSMNEAPLIIKSHILTSIISKYEIINEETSNQTFILYINDPINSNTNLMKLFVNDESPRSDIEWQLADENIFQYEKILKDGISDLIIRNKIEFKDQSTYKTTIRLKQLLRKKKKQALMADRIAMVLAEIKLEFRVDFDPLLFEKNEYTIHLTQSNLLKQDLIKIALKERASNANNYLKNVIYRLTSTQSQAQESDDEFFDINSSTGHLSTRKPLTSKYLYEFNVIGSSNELQKTAMAKVKINVDCFNYEKKPNNFVSTSLFENSPNRTQIAMFKSICTNSHYQYSLAPNVTFKFCNNVNNCSSFDLEMMRINSNIQTETNNLFNLDNSGNLMTNYPISTNLIMSLLNQDDLILFEDILASSNYESSKLSILLKASFKNSISSEYVVNYDIEILIQNAPKITNFDETITIDEDLRDEVTKMLYEEKDTCIFNYKFPIKQQVNTTIANSFVPMHRFVKIDPNSAHSEANYESLECFASFFIYNNGCLALKHDQINRIMNNQTVTKDKCYSIIQAEPLRKIGGNQSVENDFIILKSGSYAINFKLCFYDNNKVSCSQMYKQTIVIKKDLFSGSKLKISVKEHTHQQMFLSSLPFQLSRHMNSTKTSFIFFNDANKSFYLLILIVAILIVALVVVLTFTILFVIYAKPSSKNNFGDQQIKSKFPINRPISKDDVLVVTSNNFSESDSSKQSTNLNTPETSSNAATTSSKLSKTDDESEDMVKIQVSDDCMSIKNNSSQFNKYPNEMIYHPTNIHNNNFNFGGSFSSLNSSSRNSNQLVDNLVKPNTRQTSDFHQINDNNEGLYSVKNASIQFDFTNQMNKSNNNLLMKSYDFNNQMNDSITNSIISSNQHIISNINPLGFTNNLDIYCPISNNNNIQSNSNLSLNSQNKANTLKKLKKEAANKKSGHNQLNFINEMSISNDSCQIIDENLKCLYETFKYDSPHHFNPSPISQSNHENSSSEILKLQSTSNKFIASVV